LFRYVKQERMELTAVFRRHETGYPSLLDKVRSTIDGRGIGTPSEALGKTNEVNWLSDNHENELLLARVRRFRG
jgi:hypothetical protein